MEAPEGVILKAMVNGIAKGRDGKGSIFVFAAGNGGGVEDQCNFDGYTNSIFSITIGAVDRKGLHPYYSELCSAMMMVAPSSGSGDHIVSSILLEIAKLRVSIRPMSAKTNVLIPTAVLLLLHLLQSVSLPSHLESGKLPLSCRKLISGPN
jgi:hypothetical protein